MEAATAKGAEMSQINEAEATSVKEVEVEAVRAAANPPAKPPAPPEFVTKAVAATAKAPAPLDATVRTRHAHCAPAAPAGYPRAPSRGAHLTFPSAIRAAI